MPSSAVMSIHTECCIIRFPSLPLYGKSLKERDMLKTICSSFVNVGTARCIMGIFSSSSVEETLRIINERIASAHNTVFNADCLLLTFGTAWVYEQKHTGRIVGNCHKQPDKLFTRRLLSVEEIVVEYFDLLKMLQELNPNLKVLFTVSPIRHAKDGMHGNQISVRTLDLNLPFEQVAGQMDRIAESHFDDVKKYL